MTGQFQCYLRFCTPRYTVTGMDKEGAEQFYMMRFGPRVVLSLTIRTFIVAFAYPLVAALSPQLTTNGLSNLTFLLFFLIDFFIWPTGSRTGPLRTPIYMRSDCGNHLWCFTSIFSSYVRHVSFPTSQIDRCSSCTRVLLRHLPCL
jgi:hypothetical protein